MTRVRGTGTVWLLCGGWVGSVRLVGWLVFIPLFMERIRQHDTLRPFTSSPLFSLSSPCAAEKPVGLPLAFLFLSGLYFCCFFGFRLCGGREGQRRRGGGEGNGDRGCCGVCSKGDWMVMEAAVSEWLTTLEFPCPGRPWRRNPPFHHLSATVSSLIASSLSLTCSLFFLLDLFRLCSKHFFEISLHCCTIRILGFIDIKWPYMRTLTLSGDKCSHWLADLHFRYCDACGWWWVEADPDALRCHLILIRLHYNAQITS